jgi:hypothetical protein
MSNEVQRHIMMPEQMCKQIEELAEKEHRSFTRQLIALVEAALSCKQQEPAQGSALSAHS